MKKAITLAQTIGIILIVSFLLIITLKQASITAKHTQDSYAYQRAELFSQSAVEMAILAIHAHDRNTSGDCLQNININDENFDAKVEILRYYLHNDEPNKCTTSNLHKIIETEASNGMAWMKITVTPKNKFEGKNIKLVRTTLQKL